MTAKQKLAKLVRKLPAKVSIEDALERLMFLTKVERGLQQANSNQTHPHAKVKKKMAKWLK